MCKIFPSISEEPAMRWHSKLPSRSISIFETLAEIFTVNFSMYRDVKKCHEDVFSMNPQSIHESVRNYLERFWANLAEVERPDELVVMAFKRGLYVYFHLCQKLKKKYNYRTLGEFDNETSRDDEAQNKDPVWPR